MQETSLGNRWKVDKFWRYLETRPDIKVISLTLNSHQMRSLFDKDVHDYFNTSTVSGLSEIIDAYIETSQEDRDWFVNESHSGHWSSVQEDTYVIYQMFKVTWLKNDIAKNGVQAPVQLFKTVESYHCHPGSDKKYALSVLDRVETIPAFYIWYPELDPDPFFEHYEHTEIKTAQEFIDMFVMANHDTFNFEWGKLEVTKPEGSKIGGPVEWKGMDHFTAIADNICEILRKKELRSHNEGINPWIFEPWSEQHLSYHDSVHRTQMENQKEIVNNIYLVDEETFNLDGIIFNKIKIADTHIWMPEQFNNFPQSIADKNWQYDPESCLKFSLDYIGKIKGEM